MTALMLSMAGGAAFAAGHGEGGGSSEPAKSEAAKGEGGKGEAGKGEEGKKDATEAIKLAPIVVPIIVASQVVGQAGVRVQLQLADPSQFDAVDELRPRLRDALLAELYSLCDQLQARPKIIDETLIKQHFGRVAERVLGAGKVREIKILQTYERRSDRPQEPVPTRAEGARPEEGAKPKAEAGSSHGEGS